MTIYFSVRRFKKYVAIDVIASIVLNFILKKVMQLTVVFYPPHVVSTIILSIKFFWVLNLKL